MTAKQTISSKEYACDVTDCVEWYLMCAIEQCSSRIGRGCDFTTSKWSELYDIPEFAEARDKIIDILEEFGLNAIPDDKPF